MKILLISNSFGVNLQTYAKQIAKVNGLDLEIYTLYIGGCSLELHDKNIRENNKAYELFVDGETSSIFMSIDEALRLKDWDYISLQQASHLSGDISSYYPYLNSVYTYVRIKCPKAKIMWHQTWAYSGKNPFKYNELKQWLPTFKFKNNFEMKDAIDLTLEKIKNDFKFDLIVNSGDVVFEAMKEFEDVYDSEGFHLNKLGCYLIGSNLVKTLLNKELKNIYFSDDLDKNICEKATYFVNKTLEIYKNMLIRGRYKTINGFLQFFNVGSGVSLCVQGKSITFDIKSIVQSCFVYIIKDFDYNQKVKFFIDEDIDLTIPLEDDRPHYIDLVKADEATANSLVIRDIKIDGKILKYAEKPNKFVKVYGDSTIAGYGILAHDGEAGVDTNDGVEDFCFRALFDLKYDFDLFAASGWGLTFSAYTNPKEIGIEKYRENLCVNSNEKWTSRKPDLLIISLGTNDFAYIEQNPQNKDELIRKFIDSYDKLIEKERENFANLPVLMVYGTLKEESVYPLIEKTYEELSKKLNNIYIVKLPGDNSGISNHSYVSFHKKMSEVLKEKILSIIQ